MKTITISVDLQFDSNNANNVEAAKSIVEEINYILNNVNLDGSPQIFSDTINVVEVRDISL